MGNIFVDKLMPKMSKESSNSLELYLTLTAKWNILQTSYWCETDKKKHKQTTILDIDPNALDLPTKPDQKNEANIS